MTDERPPSMRSKATLFYSIAAQHDNLGDIAIRRRVLGWLTSTDHRVYVYAGAMPSSYVDAFELDDRVEIITKKSRMLLAIASSLARGRVFLILPPGPSGFGGLKRNLRVAGTTAATLLARLRGGGAICLGASFRGRGKFGTKLHTLLVSRLALCVVRDDVSRVGREIDYRLAPDLAFGVRPESGSRDRHRLSVSLRADKTVDVAFLREIKQVAEENRWQLTFVTQVARDGDQHRRLATELGAELVAWEGSHAEQLRRVEQAYAQSVGVVSDRLHALIFGSDHGALPVGIVHDGIDKLTATFAVVYDLPVIRDGARRDIAERLHRHQLDPGQLHSAMIEAESEIDAVRSDVIDVLR